MKETMPNVKFEYINDGQGEGLIEIEQDDNGEAYSVYIHPMQLRYMAEQLGMTKRHDPSSQNTIDQLSRRLRKLHERINFLAEYLSVYSDSKHADLSYEQTYANATADIADEFCFDLESFGKVPEKADLIVQPDTNPAQASLI